MQSKNIVITILILLIVIGASYLLLKKETTVSSPTTATSTSSTSTSTTPSSSTSSAKVHTSKAVVVVTARPVQPNYSTPLSFISSVSVGQQTSLNAQFAADTAAIAKNSNDFDSWVDLGIVHRLAGDYTGAATIWSYVSKAWPTNGVSFSNLGDLYLNYLKDYPASVSNYKIAIKNNPTNLDAYKNIFQVYTTTAYTGGVGAAADILKQGIMSNPKAVDLQVILARYYASHGDLVNAKATYNAAINNAQGQGETTLATQIQTEAAGL